MSQNPGYHTLLLVKWVCEMTEKERKRLADRASKLKPRPDQLPSGMWRCRVSVGGKRVTVIEETPELAHAKALAMKAGLVQDHQDREEERKGNITLSAAIDAYIANRENLLSPSTINGYKEIKRNRFKSLMDMKVRDIETFDLQQAINKDAETVSCKTIKNALGLVASVIQEYKDINFKRLRLPREKRTEHAFLDDKGMIDLFDAIRGSDVEIPILLAVWLGLRRSEILGLCWDCVDFTEKKVHVKRTYLKDKDGGYVLVENTKTAASTRTLDCPDYILSKLAVYKPTKRNGRIFTMHPNTIYKVMKNICEAHGIDFVGVHGLRHTNASVMLSLGIVDKVAMARGGWSTDITMKSVYQHVFADDKKAANVLVDTYFSGVANGKNGHESGHDKTETQ